MSKPDLRSFDLTVTDLTTELSHNLHNLRDPGSTKWVTLSDETTARIHREPSIDVGFAALNSRWIASLLEKAESFDPEHLGDGEAVAVSDRQ